MKVPIICPHDGAALLSNDSTLYRCPVCNSEYPVEGGVLRLLDKEDEFYEGAYENQTTFLPRSERPWHIWPLWLVNSGYPWRVRRHVPEGSLVVELGCASGVRYFGKRYSMVGCDLSFKSLRNLDGVYGCLVQADAAACIPLPDQTVDAVVSSYFWEHIPPDIKPRMLAECYRILRPGGKIIFLYDLETSNPLIDHYKQVDPKLYNRLFIEGDGHFGYQSPEKNLALFRTAGFQVLKHRGMEKTVFQSPSAYTKLANFGRLAQLLFGWTKALGRSPWFYLYTGFMRLIDSIVCPILPKDWARIDLVVCKKNSL